MLSLISSYQNAFIVGRLISDNLILLHEVIEKIKGFKYSHLSFVALKVDFSKLIEFFYKNSLKELMSLLIFLT